MTTQSVNNVVTCLQLPISLYGYIEKVCILYILLYYSLYNSIYIVLDLITLMYLNCAPDTRNIQVSAQIKQVKNYY